MNPVITLILAWVVITQVAYQPATEVLHNNRHSWSTYMSIFRQSSSRQTTRAHVTTVNITALGAYYYNSKNKRCLASRLNACHLSQLIESIV